MFNILTISNLNAMVDTSFYKNKKAKNTFTIQSTGCRFDGNSVTTRVLRTMICTCRSRTFFLEPVSGVADAPPNQWRRARAE